MIDAETKQALYVNEAYKTITGRRLESLKENPSSEHIRLRALSLVGGLMVFRVARAAVEAQLGWNSVEDREVEQIRSLADELASGLAQQGSRNEEKQHVEPTKHF